MTDDIETLRRENKRLRKELVEAEAVRERCNERAFRLESEVERLREACELMVDSLIASGPVSEVQQRHNWAYMHARDAIRKRGEVKP